jgi:magnesium transporter
VKAILQRRLRNGVHRRHVKHYHPPGTPPGTLQRVVEETPAVQCHLISFDRHGCRKRVVDEDELQALTLPEEGFIWLDITGTPRAGQLTALGANFDIHDLALEDVVNQGQRPKLDDYNDRLFAILTRPRWHNNELHLDQVNLFLGSHFVISISSTTADPFAAVRSRLQEHSSSFFNGGAAYLLHVLIDMTIDEYFPVLDALGEKIELTELELLDHSDRYSFAEIHALKRELMLLRGQLWPTRAAVKQLLQYEGPLIESVLVPYFKDVYDHTVYLIDLVESYRDMTASLLEVCLSSVSYRLNDIMRVLTIISTIFIPLTFITGVYGMNFVSNTASPWAMPEMHWYYGYPLVWLLIIVVAAGMLLFFRRKRWL